MSEMRQQIHSATGWDKFGTYGPRSFMDIDVTNCTTLANAVNPYCSFTADWTKKINPQIKAGKGYTLEFWWKAVEGTVIPIDNAHYEKDPNAMRRMVFFSKMSVCT